MSTSKDLTLGACDEEEATAHTDEDEIVENKGIPMNMEAYHNRNDPKQPVTTTSKNNKCFRCCSSIGHGLIGLAILYVLLMAGGIFGCQYEVAQCGEGGCRSQDEEQYEHFGRALTILFSMGSLAVLSSVVSAGLATRYWRDLSPCTLFLGVAPLLSSVTLLVIGFTI